MNSIGKNLTIDRTGRRAWTASPPAPGNFEVRTRDPRTGLTAPYYLDGRHVYAATLEAGYRFGDAQGLRCVEFAVVLVDEAMAA